MRFDAPSPPYEYKTLVCGSGREEDYDEVGFGAVAFLKSLGMIGPDVSFLDVGCGCGRIARYLLEEEVGSYVGFDRHPGMIEWCIENLAPLDPRFEFQFFEIRTPYQHLDGFGGELTATEFIFPYEDRAFDSISLTSVFTHMTLEEIDHYLGQLRRVLKPEGKILSSVLLSEGEPHNDATNFFFRPDDWLGLLKKRGFTWIETGERDYRGQNFFLLTKA